MSIAWALVLAATKGFVALFAVDAWLHPADRRFRGKAMRPRVVGYLAGLVLVPIGWRLLPGRRTYPKELDLAVTVPLLLDAAGNSLGIYERAHVDDAVHFTNAAILSGVAGAIVASQVEHRWQAALIGAGVSVVAEAGWEVMEYSAYRLGASG
ncbi:MAG: hypothetical protein ACJ761_09670, partial [Chloroflexota bacterium]